MVTMTHHAVLLRQSNPETFEHVNVEESAEQVRLHYLKLGVDEARELKRVSHLRPQHSDVQTMVVSCDMVTHEAQNALLKLFEDPPEGTQFVLVIPPTLQLLPTLLSRLSGGVDVERQTSPEWQEFLKAAHKDRLAQIDTWQKKKDADWLGAIQQGFVLWVVESNYKSKNLQLVAERLNTRGASNKMLLELLALELPV